VKQPEGVPPHDRLLCPTSGSPCFVWHQHEKCIEPVLRRLRPFERPLGQLDRRDLSSGDKPTELTGSHEVEFG
jgi:hypothetical protein